MANIQIDIDRNGTTTLATVGKYCDRNIDINVSVDTIGTQPTGTLSIFQNGTYDVRYYANAEVNVESTGGGSGGGSWDDNTIKAVIGRSITNITIPEGTTKIGWGAFANCANLVTVNLPESITEIGTDAFVSCYELALTSLPSNLITIGGNAFIDTNIAITTIPRSVKTISYDAFKNCLGLTSLTFEGTPTSIARAFYGCSNLRTINVPWSAGEVSGAPWGATSATINYNYTGE